MIKPLVAHAAHIRKGRPLFNDEVAVVTLVDHLEAMGRLRDENIELMARVGKLQSDAHRHSTQAAKNAQAALELSWLKNPDRMGQ